MAEWRVANSGSRALPGSPARRPSLITSWARGASMPSPAPKQEIQWYAEQTCQRHALLTESGRLSARENSYLKDRIARLDATMQGSSANLSPNAHTLSERWYNPRGSTGAMQDSPAVTPDSSPSSSPSRAPLRSVRFEVPPLGGSDAFGSWDTTAVGECRAEMEMAGASKPN